MMKKIQNGQNLGSEQLSKISKEEERKKQTDISEIAPKNRADLVSQKDEPIDIA